MGAVRSEITSTTGRIRRSIPVLVLGNKIDSHGAVSEEELSKWLKLPVHKGDMADREGRLVKLFMCSIVIGQGYQNGFEWLASHV